MKNNKTYQNALWNDCETDEEKEKFLICGRGHETGIIAKSIQNEIANYINYKIQVEKRKG